MDNLFKERHILCIDLKSFFASCECVKKGVDPFNYPLVVANPNQGDGAITLAVTPFLKKLGVKSRGRIFEIPKNIKYEISMPHMNYYISKSKEVVSVYLDYVAKEDIHIYSIDECFLDVTSYLKLYQKTDYELAKEILKKVYDKTGLTATCGIGPNMLLAKVSMDIEAKHNTYCISKWTYDDVPKKLWKISPLSDMWGIGKNMEKRLNSMNIFTIKDLAKTNPGILKDKFGIVGIELWNHANGIDNSEIKDFNNITKDKSYSNSQVLFKDYNEKNITIIINEMIDNLCARLRKNNKECLTFGLGITYSKNTPGGFYHNIKLDNATDKMTDLIKYASIIFDRYYENLPIRKVTVCAGNLRNKLGTQLNLFEEYVDIKKEDNINEAIDQIKKKYGKNSVLKASSLLEDSTIKERNNKVGGHNA